MVKRNANPRLSLLVKQRTPANCINQSKRGRSSEKNNTVFTDVKGKKPNPKVSKNLSKLNESWVSNKRYKVLTIEDEGNFVNKFETPIQKEKKKILVCADSHGRDLAWNINQIQNTHDDVGFVRPGGYCSQILNSFIIEQENLQEDDALVLFCGSNDLGANRSVEAINNITSTLGKVQHTKIILIDIPICYDLNNWSCVNSEVDRTNTLLKDLSQKHKNVKLVEASKAARHLHTSHSMHFNHCGKRWLADLIAKQSAAAQTASYY